MDTGHVFEFWKRSRYRSIASWTAGFSYRILVYRTERSCLGIQCNGGRAQSHDVLTETVRCSILLEKVEASGSNQLSAYDGSTLRNPVLHMHEPCQHAQEHEAVPAGCLEHVNVRQQCLD